MKNHVLAAILILYTISVSAQSTAPNHEKRIYKNEEGKVFVNKALPVYLSISASADGTDGEVLEGKEPKYSNPMYLDSEGYNSIRSPWKVDPETGKTVYPKQEVIFEVYADSKPPATNVTFSATKKIKIANASVMNSGTFSLSAQDALSGLKAIYYRLNSQDFVRYDKEVSFQGKGTYQLEYYAVDHVGNVEMSKSMTIKTDDQAPATSLKVAGDLSASVVSSRSTIELEATDNLSGVEHTYYMIDEGKSKIYTSPLSLSSLAEGDHTLTYYTVDMVGNEEEKKSYPFFLDKSAPRVIDEVIGNTFIANGKEYYSGKTKLKLVAMDNKAGVKEIRYSLNGGEFTLYEAPFYLSQAGNLNVEVLVMDKVNNRTRTSVFSGKDNLTSYVDLSGPTLSYSLVGPSFKLKDTVYVSQNTKITLKGKDNDSGFKEIDYQVDNGVSETYSQPFSVENEGFHRITYNGYDNLSNSSTSNILCIVDNSGPDVFHRFSIDSKKTKEVSGKAIDVYPPHVVLFLSSTDKYAGLDKINYRINGGSILPYRSLIENFKKDTQYTINAIVVDELGNENQEEFVFYIE